jgi:glycosyltransferase involved in cell wall biosynthesis
MHSEIYKPPLFSVVVPTCNRIDMLQRAIASVRRQTEPDFELIIVDDGTHNADFGWIDELNDHRTKLIRNPTSMGVAYARNIGVAAAVGTYISFLDDDDEYLPSFLSSTYAHLKSTPCDVAMTWCGVKYIDYPQYDEGEKVVRVNDFSTMSRDKVEIIENLLSIGLGFGVTFKSACLRALGGFNPALTTVEDIDLFLRLLVHGYLADVIPGVHVVLHNHRSRRLTDVALHSTRIRECEWLLESYQDLVHDHPHIRTRLIEHISLLREEVVNGDGGTHLRAARRTGWPSMGRWSSK